MSKNTQPADPHEWISFEDPEEDRTWVIDATFLLSSWTCIFGRGCKGVLDADATEMEQGCCSYGAHFADKADIATVRRSSARLTEDQWQFRSEAQRNGFLDTDPDTGATVTRLHNDACIFLNRPDFHRGSGCALHVGALDAGERPMDWKPDVCWQVPLHLEEHTDDDGHITSIVREWKRRDWGEAGHEFHWWCTDAKHAFVGSRPVYKEMRDELSELVEPHVYEIIVKQLRSFEQRRSQSVALPHPALKKR